MKKAAAFLFSAALLAGCTTTETGRVSYNEDGSTQYGLDDQPGTSATAEGALMPGAYDTGDAETGQFTGHERSPARVGQYPVPPREADVTEMERDNPPRRQVGTGIVPPMNGHGAGSLGQSGLSPGGNVSSSSIMTSPTNPGLTTSSVISSGGGVNPPTAPTLSGPLTSSTPSRLQNDNTAFGASATTETGTGAQALPPGPASTTWRPADNIQDSTMTVVPDISDRVRQALTSGRPGRISTLTSDRIEDIDIEALNGKVTLRGTVRSETEKLMLQNKVSQVPGVTSVNNQLRVTSPERKGMDDATQPEERANILVPEK